MATKNVKQILAALDDARGMQDSKATEEIYNRLRSLLQKECAPDSHAIYVLDRYREKPNIWEAALKDELAQTQVDQDKKIIQMVERLTFVEHEQQQAIFERLTAEAASLYETLQHSNRHFRDQFEQRLRFGLFMACSGLLSLLVAIFNVSRDNMHLALSILITTFVIEALSVLLFLGAKHVDKYTESINEELLQAACICRQIELVACTDGEIRRHLSRFIVDRLLKNSSEQEYTQKIANLINQNRYYPA